MLYNFFIWKKISNRELNGKVSQLYSRLGLFLTRLKKTLVSILYEHGLTCRAVYPLCISEKCKRVCESEVLLINLRVKPGSHGANLTRQSETDVDMKLGKCARNY